MKKYLLAALLLFASPVWATNYYVAKDCTGGAAAPNCSDANAGTTRQTARLTWASAISLMSSGDTLTCGDGVYVEQINKTIPGGPSNASRTTIQAENRNACTLRGTSDFAVIWLKSSENGGDNITFNGIDVDCVNGGSDCAPYYTDQGGTAPSNITIENGTMRNGRGEYGSGVEITVAGAEGSNHYIYNNDIYNNGDPAFTNHAHGIYASASSSIFENNRIHGNAAYGIQCVNGSTDSIIRNNVIYSEVNRGGIFVGNSTNCLVYNNIIYNNNTNNTGSSGGIDIDGATSANIYNNTIYGNSGKAVWQVSGTSTDVENNIFVNNGSDGFTVDAGTETHGFNFEGGDPLFVNAAAADFHLQSTSTAINAGTTLASVTSDYYGVTRPQGAAYDIGAYEFQPTPPGASIDIFRSTVIR